MNTVGAGEGRWEWNKTVYLCIVVGREMLLWVQEKRNALGEE